MSTPLGPDLVAEVRDALSKKPKQLLISGRWTDALDNPPLSTLNPATGEITAKFASASAADVDRAVAAARAAFEGPWRKWSPYDRQRALTRLADLVENDYPYLGLLDTLDMGAPWARTSISRRPVGLLHWYAAQALGLHGETIPNSVPGTFFSYTLREPVGVVGAIIPWNGPIPGAIWKIGPVLATGCTMVLKPAEETPLSALRLGELCLEAGIPEGVVNVVTGSGEIAGAALAAHPDVDKVAFTGSRETGREIVKASAGNLKRLTLELGGKSPNIICDDADLELAIPGSAMAIFGNSGQVCSAGSRLFVHASIYDEVVQGVAAVGAALKIGNGVDLETELGPLVSQQQMDRVLGYMDIGTSEGAHPVTGGGRLMGEGCENGFFVEPTVFRGVDNEMRVAQEEIFGPVVAAIPFDDLEMVAELANDTPFGLGAGVWTLDVNKAHALAGRIRAGTVWINGYQAMDPAVPFGGYKMSGYGRESGTEQLEGYVNVKAVWLQDTSASR